MYSLKRNFIIWTITVLICSASSFIMALKEMRDVSFVGMVMGIMIIIYAYTISSSSSQFHRFKNLYPLGEKALRYAFCFKIFIAVVSLLVLLLLPKSAMLMLIPEILTGMGAMYIVSALSGLFSNAFLVTVLTTVVDGFLMSLAVLIIAVIIWLVLEVYRGFREQK